LYFLLLLIRLVVRSQTDAAIKSKNLKISAALKMKKKKLRKKILLKSEKFDFDENKLILQ